MADSQYQFLCKADGVTDGSFWANKSGGDTKAESRKTYDGGVLDPEVSAARAQTDDITLTRPWRGAIHSAEHVRLKKQCGRLRTTLSIQPTDEDMIANGEPEVYPNALLVEVHAPEGDASGEDDATWEVVFAVAKLA